MDIRVCFDNGDYLATKFNGTMDEAEAYYVGKRFNMAYGEKEELHTCVMVEPSPDQQYRRIQFTRYGYAVVPAHTDIEAREAGRTINPKDIEWEPVKGDLLDDFEVIEVVGPNGESINE